MSYWEQTNGYDCMLRNLSLKQTSVLMTLLLLLAGGGFMASSHYINSEVRSVKDAWTEFQLVRSEKARLGGQLRAALGYGGMIHSFKNFILRKDTSQRDVALDRIGGVRTVLGQYSLLPLTGTERIAIEDISKTIEAYRKAVSTAEAAIQSGKTASQTDDLTRVDDSLALRGLETLSLEAVTSGADEVVITKSVLISRLLSEAGYGGMIHNFKNYVLRGEAKFRTAALQNLSVLNEIIAQFKSLKVHRGESIALLDLEQTLKAYSSALSTIKGMIDDGGLVEEIDAKVKVSDGAGLRALNLLVQEANLDILAHSRAVDTSLDFIVVADQVVSISLIVLMLGIAAMLLWVLRKHIIGPLSNVSVGMRRIANGDYDISIVDPIGNNEIADMTRDLQILLKNSIRRHEVETRLAETNEEMNQQLSEMQHLREQADEQAAEAVGMAENLVFATEEAENAKAKALADERRTRSIMNTVQDAIITSNSKGEIETFNTGAQTIFGYAHEEVIGRNVSFLMPEPYRSQHDGFLESFLKGQPRGLIGKTVELEAQRKNGEQFPIDLTVNALYIGDNVDFIAVIRDITERKVAEEEIRRLALTDSLTGLANRNAFNKRFEDAIAQTHRHDTHLALLMIDLDKFKPVNDQYGHPVGDALLIEVADNLREICRETDVIARLGGDEFAVILTNLDDPANAHLPAEKIIAALSQPMKVLGQKVQIGASIGIAFLPGDADNMNDLITLADDALYVAKDAGRNTYRVHQKETAEAV